MPPTLGDGDALAEDEGLTLALGETEGETELDGLTEAEGDSDALGLTLAEAELLGDTDADGLSDALTLALELTEADGDTLAEAELLGLTLADGLTDALALLDGLTEADGLTLGLSELLGLTEALGLTDALAEADGDTEGLALLDGLTLADADADGPISARAKRDEHANDRSGACRRGVGIATVCVFAPDKVTPAADGETLDEGLTDALADEDGDRLADGETDADGDTLGLTEDDGLEIVSRTARCTIARSSDVPDENPTLREPCPALVSRTVRKHCAPISMDWSSVLLAPAVGGV